MDCLFCKIAKKEVFSEIIYEDQETFAILDVYPRAPGHTMVIPKVHAPNILELGDEGIAPAFLTVKKVAGILNKALEPNGFTIGINQGRSSGQVVDHLHIHVIPRFEADGGSSIHSVVNNPPKESVKEIANKIRAISQ